MGMREGVVMKRRDFLKSAAAAAAIYLGACLFGTAAAAPTALLVTDVSPGRAAVHGIEKTVAALEDKGHRVTTATSLDAARAEVIIIAGLAKGGGATARLLDDRDAAELTGPEALAIRRIDHRGRPAVLVAGSDDRGLMYALLDVADRIGWAADPMQPLDEVRATTERPDTPERALTIYTMHRGCFEQRFFDDDYWDHYFDMLAGNRFNTFVLIFGYENWGYFAPPYPYFFDVAGFPKVHVVGLSKSQQRRYLETLNRRIEMAHDRGLNFTIGIWDHIYRGGVQGPLELTEKPTPGIVWGLTADNLVPYTKAALREFLRRVPRLDAIQFRMHGESGLKRSEMEGFWTDVYKMMRQTRPDLRFDARAKNFPDALIDRAHEIGVPIRL